jgi:hypothetical protein
VVDSTMTGLRKPKNYRLEISSFVPKERLKHRYKGQVKFDSTMTREDCPSPKKA